MTESFEEIMVGKLGITEYRSGRGVPEKAAKRRQCEVLTYLGKERIA